MLLPVRGVPHIHSVVLFPMLLLLLQFKHIIILNALHQSIRNNLCAL